MDGAIASQPDTGYFLEFCDAKNDDFAHISCGLHSIRGADCPNCLKPLLRFFEFDTRDARLELAAIPLKSLPLLYCWTCNISQKDFFYRVLEDGSVRLLVYGEQGVEVDFPYEDYPLFFAETGIVLTPIPPGIQMLIREINKGNDEAYEYEEHIECSMPQNQVGGEPFLYDPDASMICPDCQKTMPLFAAVGDKAPNDESFHGNEGAQVVFHFCRDCQVVGVYQTCD